MVILLLILIAFALLAGVIFLAYKFGDAVLEMLTQKSRTASLPYSQFCFVLRTKGKFYE